VEGESVTADRARRWLKSRRVIVVDVDPERAHSLARALQACGATAVVVSHVDAELQSAHALDADVMLVAGDDPAASRPVVDALQAHPRTRWVSVVPISDAQLTPGGAAPDLTSIANAIERSLAPAVELAVRAKGKLPHETRVETLGAYRLLRVLGDTRRALHVVLWDGRIWAELELEDGRVCSARARGAEPEQTLSRAHALAAVLELGSGHVRIEERPADAASDWNVSLSAALAKAAVIESLAPSRGDCADGAAPIPPAPTVPHISLAAAMALGEEGEPPSLIEPASGVRPHESGGLRSSARPTMKQISLAEAMGDAGVVETPGDEPKPLIEQRPSELSASAAPMPVSAPVPVCVPVPARESAASSAARRTHRPRARAGAAAALVALALGAAMLALAFPEGVQLSHGDRLVGETVAGSLAVSVAPPAALVPHEQGQPKPASAAPTPPPVLAPAEPAEAASAGVAANATVSRELVSVPSSRAERARFARATRLERRARRFHRARQLGKAEVTYHEALAAWPGHSLAMAGLARVHLQRKQGQEALRWAEQLVALQPDRDINQLLLGDAHALNGSRAEAESAWKRARQLGSRTASLRLRGR
jgi:hypothetical protein